MFSKKIVDNLSRSSWIRAMFEEGEKLRKIHGADKVFDFSIGNPEVEPPIAVQEKLQQLILAHNPGKHRYMANAGYMDVREKVAEYLKKETKVFVRTGTFMPWGNTIPNYGTGAPVWFQKEGVITLEEYQKKQVIRKNDK